MEAISFIKGYSESHEAKIMDIRKKFRKMKLKFEQKMNQSNIWYKQEQEAAETARRLAMENESVPAHWVVGTKLMEAQ
jgi:cell fate (sporulation/competence/biofilm development) regulator YlbF (YheA/YmcA/DUF963 family)